MKPERRADVEAMVATAQACMLEERICREVKVMKIGGGAEEIMKDLAARQMGP